LDVILTRLLLISDDLSPILELDLKGSV
jgi:hypothetical protein